MLTIKKNDSPNMAICKMNCDDGLHEKLNKYELTSFMNSHTTQLLIGKPRSGKTSLLYSLFKSFHLFKKTYHNIFIFQLSASRASMKDQLFNQLPPEQLYEELTLDIYHRLCLLLNQNTQTIITVSYLTTKQPT